MAIVSAPDDAEEVYLLLRVRSIARRCVARMVGDDAAEDIAHHIMLEFLGRQRTGRMQLRDRTLVALVQRGAFRRAMNLLRGIKHRRERDAVFLEEISDSVYEWMSPDVALEAEELQAFVARTLDLLSPLCREVYRRVREQGEPYRDVAMQLGITRSAVCAHVSEAQNRLRDALREHGVNVPAAMTNRAQLNLTYNGESAGGTTPSARHP